MSLISFNFISFFMIGFQLTVGQVTITTTPDSIEGEITKSLTVTCRFPPVSSSGFNVFSLAIKKVSDASTVQQLASINKDTHQTPHIEALNYGISSSYGIIDSIHGSFLTVEWLDPKVSESGIYQCKANVFNQVDDIFVFTENKDVSFTQASMSSVIHRLQELEIERKNLTAETNKKLNALESAFFKKSSVFNGHQYYLSLYQPPTAAYAEGACTALGGYLAEVDSKNEFDFLINLIGTPFAENIEILLGGTDKWHEGQWVSRRTGAPLTYLPWPQYEPDNVLFLGVTENCQVMEYRNATIGFVMNDFFCFNLHGQYAFYFMCEVPL